MSDNTLEQRAARVHAPFCEEGCPAVPCECAAQIADLARDEVERAVREERLRAPTPKGWRMDAYYYGFEPTGVAVIDRILSAVACAGKSFHHTEEWENEDLFAPDHLRGKSCREWIQSAADDAARALRTPGGKATLEPEVPDDE